MVKSLLWLQIQKVKIRINKITSLIKEAMKKIKALKKIKIKVKLILLFKIL
jgi:hypothetical protein